MLYYPDGKFSVILAHEHGLNPALVYEAIREIKDIAKTNNEIDKEGYFPITADELHNWTTLSRGQQVRACDILERAGLIETKLKYLPRKKCFKITEVY